MDHNDPLAGVNSNSNWTFIVLNLPFTVTNFGIQGQKRDQAPQGMPGDDYDTKVRLVKTEHLSVILHQ